MPGAKRVREKTTLYLRGIPVSVVREAKAAAARQGATLGSFVTENLERALGREKRGGQSAELRESVEAIEAADVDDELDREMSWFEHHRRDLLGRYRGQYIAVIDLAVVDHDRDFESLAARIFERFGLRTVFMPRVEEPRREIRVRSPRRVRT